MSEALDPGHWPSLFAAAERLARARSFDQVVEVVRSVAREIAAADGITFVRCDGDECLYIAEDAIESLWEGQRFKLSQCVSGWVIQQAGRRDAGRARGCVGLTPVLAGGSRLPRGSS